VFYGYTEEQQSQRINILNNNKHMKYTFSKKFPQFLCQQILREVGTSLDNFRLIYGINVRELMAELHISHLIIKRY